MGVLELGGGAEHFFPVAGGEVAADELFDVDAGFGGGEAGHEFTAAHFHGGDEGGAASGEGDVGGEVDAEEGLAAAGGGADGDELAGFEFDDVVEVVPGGVKGAGVVSGFEFVDEAHPPVGDGEPFVGDGDAFGCGLEVGHDGFEDFGGGLGGGEDAAGAGAGGAEDGAELGVFADDLGVSGGVADDGYGLGEFVDVGGSADFGEFAGGEEFGSDGDGVDLGVSVAAGHVDDRSVDDLVAGLVEVFGAGEDAVDGVDCGEVEEGGAEGGFFGFEVVGFGGGGCVPEWFGHAAWPFALGLQRWHRVRLRMPRSSSISRVRVTGSQSGSPQW